MTLECLPDPAFYPAWRVPDATLDRAKDILCGTSPVMARGHWPAHGVGHAYPLPPRAQCWVCSQTLLEPHLRLACNLPAPVTCWPQACTLAALHQTCTRRHEQPKSSSGPHVSQSNQNAASRTSSRTSSRTPSPRPPNPPHRSLRSTQPQLPDRRCHVCISHEADDAHAQTVGTPAHR